MLDRESTFKVPETVALLQEKFVPVAIDVFYHERRKDAEGDYFRKVVFQRKGMRKGRTTQGFYIFTPAGSLIVGWNNRDPGKVTRYLKNALKKQHRLGAKPIEARVDKRYDRTPPKDGLVVDVFSRVTQAEHQKKDSRWTRILRSSTGRDHLWVTAKEKQSLVMGEWPASLTRRITRYHFIDNTRGEPPMWRGDQVTVDSWKTSAMKHGFRVTGTARAKTKDDSRGYALAVRVHVTLENGRVTGFDLVARGEYWGGGRYTSNDLPKGRFGFAVATTLAPDVEASKVPPQGSRDLRGYLSPQR